MLRLIRTSMIDNATKKYFKDIVEMDETYVGGKPRKFCTQGKNKRGRGTKKTPVVGVVDRLQKRVYAKIALPNSEGQKLTGKQLLGIIEEVCITKKVKVITDEFRSYNILTRKGYDHERVDHRKEFVIGSTHTNTIESFWAILKRGVYGIYHSISVKYMQNYLNEFCFRYNNRDESQAFDVILDQAILIKSC